MTYVFLIIILLIVFLYVAVPLNGSRVEVGTSSEEIQAYKVELQAIESELRTAGADEKTLSLLRSRETYLQRQLITLAGRETVYSKTPARGWMIAFGMCLFSGGLGVYHLIGSPELTGEVEVMRPVAKQAQPDGLGGADMETLVAQLGERLKNGQGDAQGWGLYARSLMSLRRFDEAITAYDKAVDMSKGNTDSDWPAERQSAIDFIETAGPSAADIQAAQSMDGDDRQVMIQNMVDSLSAKLEDDPSDIEGWVRLLRARGVLEQGDIAQAEIRRLEQAFPEQAAIVADILERSGWSERTE